MARTAAKPTGSGGKSRKRRGTRASGRAGTAESRGSTTFMPASLELGATLVDQKTGERMRLTSGRYYAGRGRNLGLTVVGVRRASGRHQQLTVEQASSGKYGLVPKGG